MFLSLKDEFQGINDMIGYHPSPITWCDEQFNYLLGKRSKLKKRIGELSENPEIKMWEGGNIYWMGIKIIQYKESHLEEIRSILTEYMTFIANELLKPTWEFNVDVEH